MDDNKSKALAAALELRDHAVTYALLIAAAAASALFRVVPLACTGDRLVVAGAGVLRLAEGASCASVVPRATTGIASCMSLSHSGCISPLPIPRSTAASASGSLRRCSARASLSTAAGSPANSGCFRQRSMNCSKGAVSSASAST